MTGQEVGTLRDLNVQPGDVVEYFACRGGSVDYGPVDAAWIEYAASWREAASPHWRIISRAAQPLPHGHARLPSGEIIDLTAITTPFGLLPADVQQALRDHGGPYHAFKLNNGYEWVDVASIAVGALAYRVRPLPPEPKVEEVVLYWYAGECASSLRMGKDTHRITLNLRDGVPDPVAKVEAL